MSNETSTPKKSNLKKRIRTFLWRISILGVVLLIVGSIGGYVGYQEYVIKNPGEHISSKYIQSIMTQESPILYKEGEELGMLYENKYRIYIPYDEIPKYWVQALVAVEDQSFYEHHGINPYNIVGSMVSNIKAGRIVRGGSTLTQQTAKNLYNRGQRVEENQVKIAEYLEKKERLKKESHKQAKNITLVSKIEAKLWEMLNALRLDHHHSKEDILEYYANQIPIRGQGTGIAIAAKYFFDKEVKDLTLQECVFLAIIPKGPENYNPFTGVREERMEKIAGRMQAALNNMVEMGYITEDQRDELYFKELQFNHGKFHFERNILIDIVQQELHETHIQKALLKAGISNPDTAGIHIVTTIDKNIQTDALYYFRHHLSVFELQHPQNTPPKTLHKYVEYGDGFMEEAPQVHHFYDAKVIKKNKDTIDLEINGHPCVVDKKALQRIAMVWKKNKISSVLDTIRELGVLYVSVRQEGICDIEIEGKLTGGFLILNKGNIISLVGSPTNQHSVVEHDRTGVYIKNSGPYSGDPRREQLGSTWKTIVYASALQMGWVPSDYIDNYHNMFKYTTEYYFPGADHIPKSDLSTLHWAGTKSENRASVWLLSHLTDRLSWEQKKEVAEKVGLLQEEGESTKKYKHRLKYIPINKSWIPSLAFEKAKEEVLLEMSDGEQKIHLMSLEYRPDFSEEEAKTKIENNYLGSKKDNRAKWRKKHQEEIMYHHYDAIKEQFENCSLVYGELEDWHQKAKIHENFPTLKNIFRKVREETKHQDTTKNSKSGLFDRKKDIDKDDEIQDEDLSSSQNISDSETTVSKIFSVPDIPQSVVDVLWYNSKTQKIGCGLPKQSYVSFHQKLHKDMFFPIEKNTSDIAEENASSETEQGNNSTKEEVIHLEKVPSLWVNDRISLHTWEKIQDKMERYVPYFETIDLYSPEALLYHRDFIQTMNMTYIEYSAQRFGLYQSFPRPLGLAMTLGAIEMSLLEMANIYASLMRGTQYLTESNKKAYIIDSIYDNQGNLIYQTKIKEDVVSDKAIGKQLSNILHSALHYGTGNVNWKKSYPFEPVHKKTMVNNFEVPSLGKTGTAQGGRRLAFIGMLPQEYAGQWSLDDGYVLASYVGYDSNEQLHSSGALGNLPFWLETAQSLADNGFLGTLERNVPWDMDSDDMVKISFHKQTGAIIKDPEEGIVYPTIWTSTKSSFLDTKVHRIFAPLEKEGPSNVRPLHKETILPTIEKKRKRLFPSEIEEIEDTGDQIDFIIHQQENGNQAKDDAQNSSLPLEPTYEPDEDEIQDEDATE